MSNRPRSADDYDDYFAFNSLFEHDEQVLARHLRPPGLVADLGCGTGRALVPLVKAGHRGLAIDLSEPMLKVVQEKADLDELPIDCLQANLVELDALADHSVDHAICMFSTLGMIPRPRQPPPSLAALPPHSQTKWAFCTTCPQLLVQPPRPARPQLGSEKSANRPVQQRN